MKTSEHLDMIAPALIKAQGEMGAATKSSNNPFYRSEYAKIEEVMMAVIPSLIANGICILQSVTHLEGKPYMTTRLQHESGQFIEDTAPIIFDASPRVLDNGKEKSQNLVQVYGSAITYMRRYCLTALLCVPQVDKDGEDAGPKIPPYKPVEKVSLEQQEQLIQLYNLCTQDFKDKVWKTLQNDYGEFFMWRDFPINRFEKLMQHMKAHVAAQTFDDIAKECK